MLKLSGIVVDIIEDLVLSVSLINDLLIDPESFLGLFVDYINAIHMFVHPFEFVELARVQGSVLD